jgi:hypothetical protein
LADGLSACDVWLKASHPNAGNIHIIFAQMILRIARQQ